jgi:hypothetical protein
VTKARRRRRQAESGRPSLFFIVALTIGILFLIWGFARLISRPVTPPKRGSLPHYGAISSSASAIPAGGAVAGCYALPGGAV